MDWLSSDSTPDKGSVDTYVISPISLQNDSHLCCVHDM